MGPSWAHLGGSWAAFGESIGRLFSLLGALGGVWRVFRLQRPFQEQFSLNLCCFWGGPNLEKYMIYLGKTRFFRKSLFCSWAVFGILLGSVLGRLWPPKSRSWVILGRSGEVLGGVGWGVVGCCVVLCGLELSWVGSWVGLNATGIIDSPPSGVNWGGPRPP